FTAHDQCLFSHFNATAPTDFTTLSLHDALPILIEISPDAIYVVDGDGVCVLGNRAGADLVGLPQDELVGTPVTDTYLAEERDLLDRKSTRLNSSHVSISYAVFCLKKNMRIACCR